MLLDGGSIIHVLSAMIEALSSPSPSMLLHSYVRRRHACALVSSLLPWSKFFSVSLRAAGGSHEVRSLSSSLNPQTVSPSPTTQRRPWHACTYTWACSPSPWARPEARHFGPALARPDPKVIGLGWHGTGLQAVLGPHFRPAGRHGPARQITTLYKITHFDI